MKKLIGMMVLVMGLWACGQEEAEEKRTIEVVVSKTDRGGFYSAATLPDGRTVYSIEKSRTASIDSTLAKYRRKIKKGPPVWDTVRVSIPERRSDD